jgi:hypothetical protein
MITIFVPKGPGSCPKNHVRPLCRCGKSKITQTTTFECNYCAAFIEGHDDSHLKHLIDQKKHVPMSLIAPSQMFVDISLLVQENGLNVTFADKLQKSFAWIPPLAADSDDYGFLAGPEPITVDKL